MEAAAAVEPRLPLLPLPKLEQTMRRFVEVVEGILSPEELETAQAEATAFLEGDGARLDAILQEWKPEEGNMSYVEKYAGCARVSFQRASVLACGRSPG